MESPSPLVRPIYKSDAQAGYDTDQVAERSIAERSMLIKNMIEDLGNPGEEPIPIMNVSPASIIRPLHRFTASNI